MVTIVALPVELVEDIAQYFTDREVARLRASARHPHAALAATAVRRLRLKLRPHGNIEWVADTIIACNIIICFFDRTLKTLDAISSNICLRETVTSLRIGGILDRKTGKTLASLQSPRLRQLHISACDGRGTYISEASELKPLLSNHAATLKELTLCRLRIHQPYSEIQYWINLLELPCTRTRLEHAEILSPKYRVVFESCRDSEVEQWHSTLAVEETRNVAFDSRGGRRHGGVGAVTTRQYYTL